MSAFKPEHLVKLREDLTTVLHEHEQLLRSSLAQTEELDRITAERNVAQEVLEKAAVRLVDRENDVQDLSAGRDDLTKQVAELTAKVVLDADLITAQGQRIKELTAELTKLRDAQRDPNAT